MGRITNARRAGSAPTRPIDRNRGSGSRSTNRSSADELLREGPRVLLRSAGMFVIGAVILFVVGLVLEAVAFSVVAVFTVITAMYLRQKLSR